MPGYIEDPLDPGAPEVIPGLLPRHGHLALVAETNVGKTLLALEIIESVLTGRPLWGQLTPTETYQRVAYVVGEYDDNYVKQLWVKLEASAPPHSIRLLPRRTLVSQGQVHSEHVRTYKEECAGCQLVIFDPFSAFVIGPDVENDASLTRATINTMLEIAGGHSVIIPAHMGKPYYLDTAKDYVQRGSYAARGSSSIEDTPMACFYFTQSRSEASPDALFYLKNRKTKFGAPPGYFLLRDPDTLRHKLINVRSSAGKRGMASRWGSENVNPGKDI